MKRLTISSILAVYYYYIFICASDMSMEPELNARVSKATGAFKKLNSMKVWGDKIISRGVKLILYKVVVLSTLLYGCETWALTRKQESRLEVFQMKCLRRILGITLLDRVPNNIIRARYGKDSKGDVCCETQAHAVVRSCWENVT